MAKVYFKVLTKATDQSKDVFIRIRFKSGSTDQSTTTGETIKLEYWNIEKQDFTKAYFKGKDPLQNRLQKLKSHVLEESLETNEYPKGWLLSVVDQYRFPKKYEKLLSTAIYDWAERHIASINVAKRTKYKYEAMLKSLKEFDPDLDWKGLDLAFMKKYSLNLERQGLAQNTIFDRMKVIKALARAAEEEKVNLYSDYKAFKLKTEESDNIYLNEEEISRISRVNLDRHPWLYDTRDLYVIASWVGVRFSDYDKISSENIKGNLIYFKQAKTKGRVIIPLHPVVKEILERHDWKLPKPKANQPFNRDLKLIAKASRLRQKEIKGITKGGAYSEKTLEKWEMVTSHTARRSFATNLYNQDVEVITIMKMTGHRTINSFLRYIKVSEEEHARKLQKHWEKIYNL
ncbi:site-specific integrase [Maribellus sp. YY47]|uniref:site-specific integrase n=1 Tax=Maribellus sp. YY47 TaxID=2929486 RepID=UPI00200067A8|nr:site-specific integrase [Maribellus sp. YY47]MCK3684382.1 site-specific integrase [Maribellus sp. YY47]